MIFFEKTLYLNYYVIEYPMANCELHPGKVTVCF